MRGNIIYVNKIAYFPFHSLFATSRLVLLLNSHLDGWDAQYLSHLDDCACQLLVDYENVHKN